MEYYDAVLGLIPLVLIGTAGALRGVGVETAVAVPAAAGVAALLVGHAMFVNAPTPTERSRPGDSGAPGPAAD